MQRFRLILLLALFPAAAVVGGIVLGQFLAMRAPVDQAAAAAVAANGPVDISSLPLANGTGVPEPPQPRMDGSRGVPPRVTAGSKPIPTVSASGTSAPPGTGVMPVPGTGVNPSSPPVVAGIVADPSLNISTAPYVPGSTPSPGTPGGPPTQPSSGVSGWMPQADLGPAPRQSSGYSQVVPVSADDDEGPAGLQPMVTQYANAPAPAQSVSVSSRPPAQAAPSPTTNMPAWQRVLRIAIDRCEAQNSGRNACVQQARNNYCEANRGWGTVPECGP
jgi:hypothetical protein